jgi:hypothetical protein
MNPEPVGTESQAAPHPAKPKGDLLETPERWMRAASLTGNRENKSIAS